MNVTSSRGPATSYLRTDTASTRTGLPVDAGLEERWPAWVERALQHDLRYDAKGFFAIGSTVTTFR